MQSQEQHDKRWDIHTERQIAAAKGGATAVTVLNSGSWLALLSQTGKLQDVGVGYPIIFWGAGALVGTLLWLFIYRGTLLQWKNDIDRSNAQIPSLIDRNIKFGVSAAIVSLVCFGAGVGSLAYSFW